MRQPRFGCHGFQIVFVVRFFELGQNFLNARAPLGVFILGVPRQLWLDGLAHVRECPLGRVALGSGIGSQLLDQTSDFLALFGMAVEPGSETDDVRYRDIQFPEGCFDRHRVSRQFAGDDRSFHQVQAHRP